MIYHSPCRRKKAAQQGIALVMVLAFVALLTIVVLAFFSRVTTESSIAGNNSSLIKADLLARSGLDIVVSDLKREVAARSNAVTDGAGKVLYYVPKTNLDAIPARSGDVADIPNLVRRSYAGDAALPYPSLASPTNSTEVSANGRSVSPQRWNASYMLPYKNPSTTDNTPVTSFVAPDWVYVDREGPEKITAVSSILADTAAGNAKFVVGRYAYAVYDEGGLLDMNVAGCPTNSTLDQTGRKISVAYADLGQLPPLATLSPAGREKFINSLVGWRNFASAKPSGSFPDFTFNPAQAQNYYDFVAGNKNGFLSIYNTGLGNPTDQAFLSRQQLVQFVRGAGVSPEVLQYMGTFSRDVDYPMVLPPKELPLIRSGKNTNAAAGGNIAIWGTGNDAYQTERFSATAKSPHDINPQFPAVRVLQSFTRPDGTTANVGDPLVNKRFPLSRLALLLRTATAPKLDTDPIYRNFGLYRSSTSSPWTYDHGDNKGILRLSYPSGLTQGVEQRNREPDFFELLKAAINVGSVGKSGMASGATTTGHMANLQHNMDVLSALQILQIGANIIDQYDEDGYPTRIQIVNAAGVPVEVRGIEDLPYIESVRNRVILKDLTLGNWLMQPVLWNPHDPNTPRPANYASISPKNFRMRVFNPDNDAAHAEAFILVNFNADYKWGVDMDYNLGQGEPLTFNAGEANNFYGFRQPTLLAERNIPAKTNVRGNDVSQTYADAGVTFVGLQVASDFPLKLPHPVDPANPSAPIVYEWLNKANWGARRDNATGLETNLTIEGMEFALDYQDDLGQWIAYDNFRFQQDSTGIGWYNSGVTTDAKAVTWHQTTYSKSPSGIKTIDKPRKDPSLTYSTSPDKEPTDPNDPAQFQQWDVQGRGWKRTDPRTNRWGTGLDSYCGIRPTVDRPNNIYEALRGGTGISLSVSTNAKADKGFQKTNNYNSVGKGFYAGYQDGYSAENSVRDTRQEGSESAPDLKRYNRDPDGIIRRAMGGYATDPLSGGTFDKTEGLPLANNNFASRPIILNRPFTSVGELGHVFRGSPWKNLDFSFPESADAALLDVFCVSEPRADGLTAGRVDLNTRQVPVLQAIIAGAGTDPSSPTAAVSSAVAAEIAQKLVARTSDLNVADRKGPLVSRSGLVGAWNPDSSKVMGNLNDDPDFFFSGFASDIGTATSLKGTAGALIPRQRESAIRALGETGNTRTWNLMIDLIAQSGRFPSGSNTFLVEGEKRFWLHIAIDRLTGKVIDQQLEQVIE